MSNTKHRTDKCAHCGADRRLHQFETDLCPRYGRESFPAPQQWDETKFEDAGEKRLRDAAPELLAMLCWYVDEFPTTGKITEAKELIKKATL